MDFIENEVHRLLDSSLASSTLATYKRGVNSFDSFRREVGFNSQWPAPVQHVVAFIAHLSIEGKSPSSISTYSSALAYVHKLNGWSNPCDNFIIKKLKEGARRTGRQPDSRRPISLTMLRQLSHNLSGICSSTYETTVFRTAFLLAFFGFLRVGEFTALSNNAHAHNILSIGDIHLTHDSLSVTIRFSKTDQRGRSTTLHFSKGPETILCPVTAMRCYLDVRPCKAGPLFIHFAGNPLTRYQFGQILTRSVSAMGLSPTNFSSHSFRIGAATSAAVSGIPIDTIKSMGRWQSSAVNSYIRPHRILNVW